MFVYNIPMLFLDRSTFYVSKYKNDSVACATMKCNIIFFVEMFTHYDEIHKDEKKYESESQINIDIHVAS